MNFQDKVIETTTDLRAQARLSFDALKLAGRGLNKVARRHASRFVEQNSSLAREAGKDVSALARATFLQFMSHPTTVTRKAPAKRKRTRTVSKAA